jgi:hypothetical protein
MFYDESAAMTGASSSSKQQQAIASDFVCLLQGNLLLDKLQTTHMEPFMVPRPPPKVRDFLGVCESVHQHHQQEVPPHTHGYNPSLKNL